MLHLTLRGALSSIVASMLTLTPEQYRPAEKSERMRIYRDIAGDIEAAVDNPLTRLPFDGPKAREASEDALVAIAANESSFSRNVRDCLIKGDKGKSVSVFQLHVGPGRKGHSEKEICEDHVLAAKLALEILNWYPWVWKTEQLFNGYATGRYDVSSSGGNRQHYLFRQLIKAHGIKVSWKKGAARLYAEQDPTAVVKLENDPQPGADTVSAK